MSALNDICICISTSGIKRLWYLDMSLVTNQPDDCTTILQQPGLTTSAALKPLLIDETSGTYEESENLNDHGVYYGLEVQVQHNHIAADKDEALLSLAGRRLLIFFEDNNGNYRYMLNARRKQKANTESFLSGKSHYTLALGRQSRKPAYYFTGTVTKGGDGSLTLS
jgi:hypothetical protein